MALRRQKFADDQYVISLMGLATTPKLLGSQGPRAFGVLTPRTRHVRSTSFGLNATDAEIRGARAALGPVT